MLVAADVELAKSRIAYGAVTSPSQGTKYVPQLLACGLLQQTSKVPKRYIITDRGRQYLDVFNSIQKMCRADDNPRVFGKGERAKSGHDQSDKARR